MVHCLSCGKQITEVVNFCPDCGGNLSSNPSFNNGAYTSHGRSAWWYLAPILIGLIGGIIAYFIIRKDDPQKAKNCLILGFVLGVIQILLSLALS